MKRAQRVSRDRASEVIDEAKVEGICTGGSQAHQVYGFGVLQERFNQIDIQFRLASSQQKSEGDCRALDDREINVGHVFAINEDVMDRTRRV
jgi:hypothetical protein